MYLIPPCLTLSNIRYISRVKWRNLGKGVAPSPTPWCSSYWKGSLLVALDYGHQLYFIYIYIYIYVCVCVCVCVHVLLGAVSWICSKQHATSLCSSHLASSSGISLKSKWCSHTLVLTRLQFRITILFHLRLNQKTFSLINS